MKNKYDDDKFFMEYKKMPRSSVGLEAAGEWHQFKEMLPNLKGKTVLDLGCGYGWHCKHAALNGAKRVIGVDSSSKMLALAKEKNNAPEIEYQLRSIEDIDFDIDSFDVVISSLAFHYIESFNDIFSKIYNFLVKGGLFVFSVEHPIFTAQGTQDWCYDVEGKILHWPIDDYYKEGKRETIFLGHKVTKYHKTLSSIIQSLIQHKFILNEFIEATPSKEMLEKYPEYKNELRRPMMLLIAAKK